MKHVFLTVLACALFTGCSNSSNSSKKVASDSSAPTPTLDLARESYPKAKKAYRETVKFIPLETRDEVSVDKRRRIIYFSDKRIVVTNEIKGDVFVFDGEGKIVSHFNRLGEGPEEYLRLTMAYYNSVVVYDEVNREIFVMERIGRCQVYSEEGKYLRTFHFPENKQYREAYSYDNESLLALDVNTETDSAYVFISKTDGHLLSCIDIPIGKRRSNRHKIQSSKGPVTIKLPVQQLLRDGEDFILAEMSSDTIYRFTRDKRLIPILALTPSKQKSETPVYFQVLKVSGKCISGMKFVFELGTNPTTTMLTYDLEKGQAFEDNSPEYSISGITGSMYYTDLPANLYVLNGFPDKILKDLENGKLKGEIKEIAEKMNPKDNPVIQLIIDN
jgi:hypothetical protein